jgi:hypothetical protein
MPPKITDEQRRIRLGTRHHLATPGPDVVTVAGDLIGLHSSDPASVYLAARARCRGDVAAALDAALYDERDLVRILGMRRTMFVVPTTAAPLLQHGCAGPLARRERNRIASMIEDQGLAGDGHGWIADAAAATVAALNRLGEATANELRDEVEFLRAQIVFGEGKTWGGTVGMSTRILFLLATEGVVVRARPRGSWLSAAYRWALMDRWLGAPLPDMTPAAARAALARRWLAAYGPARVEDLKWWTGWTVTDTRRALTGVDTVAVAFDDGDEGIALAGDVETLDPPEPWVRFLPALDSTTMGWKSRDWYLGPHRAALFDRNGNAGPTVWCDGRVVGGWAQRSDGEIVFRILEDAGTDAAALIASEAARLHRWLGDVRVTPRFATPLQKELTR